MPVQEKIRDGTPTGDGPKAAQPRNRRLAVGVMLIVLALGALAAAEYFRERSAPSLPPHEPSQALIAPPAPESAPETASRPARPAEPPPPPEVINNETLRPPARHESAAAHSSGSKQPAPPAKTEAPAKGYVVQLGVFGSPENAEALRARMRKAGIETRIETRVQIGPFRKREDAEKALADAKKQGVNAVLVAPR
jgi:DedD protein